MLKELCIRIAKYAIAATFLLILAIMVYYTVIGIRHQSLCNTQIKETKPLEQQDLSYTIVNYEEAKWIWQAAHGVSDEFAEEWFNSHADNGYVTINDRTFSKEQWLHMSENERESHVRR